MPQSGDHTLIVGISIQSLHIQKTHILNPINHHTLFGSQIVGTGELDVIGLVGQLSVHLMGGTVSNDCQCQGMEGDHLFPPTY